MTYINGLGVHSIVAIDPPKPWVDVRGRASNLPSWRNEETGEVVRVLAQSGSGPTFRLWQHRPYSKDKSLSDPIETAQTQNEMADKVEAYLNDTA